MQLPSFVTWLSNTPLSSWLRYSPYPFPILIMIHIITIATFGGLVAIGNLRVLGYVMQDVPASTVLRQFRSWKWTGFIFLLISGLLIAASDPAEYYTNIMFWISWIVLAFTGLNAWIFHRGAQQTIGEWDTLPTPPRAAKRWAVCSLILWVSLIGVGRAIAFF